MSFDLIYTERADEAVRRLNRCNDRLPDIDALINEAIDFGDLHAELADARMLVGELMEEVPALSRTIEFKVDEMLATDQGFSVYSMYSHWQSQAQATLIASLLDGDTARPDPGGTYSASYRGGFVIDDPDRRTAGRDLVNNLILTTGDGELVGQDEFQLIRTEDGKFIVVLPGVTDLSSPDLGLNETHRTVRDLDRFAAESAASTGIDGNRYAQMVEQALLEANVPFGADIMIVGHSFGADTALDLAADPQFNGGAEGYTITHVVAAGYHSGPQLPHVPERTNVLVLQNHHDLAILGEMAAHLPGEILHGEGPIIANPMNVVGGFAVTGLLGAKEATEDAGGFVIGSTINLGGDLINHHSRNLGHGDIVDDVHINDFDDIFLPDNGVSHPRPNQTVVVFEGDWQGDGHHPQNYADHVTTTDDPATIDFHESVAAGGYTGRMERWSVDVTVPDDG